MVAALGAWLSFSVVSFGDRRPRPLALAGTEREVFFVFKMPAEEMRQMPQKLVQQAGSIAQKLLRKIFNS